jgi:hypothetical protein
MTMTDKIEPETYATEDRLDSIIKSNGVDRPRALELLYLQAWRERLPFALVNGRLLSPTALQVLDHAKIETLTAANLRGFAALDLPNASYVHLANC